MFSRAAVDGQFAFDAIAGGAEQLQVVKPRRAAFGDGNHMIQHQIFRLAAIGAVFAVCLRQGCVPEFMLLLDLPPFGLFDLGRNAAFVRRYAARRSMDLTAAFHKALEIAAGFVAVAAPAQPSAVGAVLVIAQQPYPWSSSKE